LRSKKGNDFTQVGNGGGGSDGKTFSHCISHEKWSVRRIWDWLQQ
jgi:hypothetical protein